MFLSLAPIQKISGLFLLVGQKAVNCSSFFYKHGKDRLCLSEDYLGYDRYTYCLGNQFKYTDPSGEDPDGEVWHIYGGTFIYPTKGSDDYRPTIVDNDYGWMLGNEREWIYNFGEIDFWSDSQFPSLNGLAEHVGTASGHAIYNNSLQADATNVSVDVQKRPDVINVSSFGDMLSNAWVRDVSYNITGQLLEQLKQEAIYSVDKTVFANFIKNDKYGKEAFITAPYEISVTFGGEASNAPKGVQLVTTMILGLPASRYLFFPGTWVAASHETTWTVRNVTVTGYATVFPDGTFTISHEFNDVFDLKTDGRESSYKVVAGSMRLVWNTFLGAGEPNVHATWNTSYTYKRR